MNVLTLNDLPDLINAATGLELSDDAVYLHNFNARAALLKASQFSQPRLPAVTLGIHYKYNDTYNSLDTDLNGTLTSIGMTDNDGVNYTLYASKMLSFLPKPVLVNLGVRNTSAAHTGLLGFQ